MLTVFLVLLLSSAASAQTTPEVRAAVTRALPTLQRSAAGFVAKRACLTCHHHSLSVMTFRLARARGFSIDPEVLRSVENRTFRQLRDSKALDDVVQSVTFNDPTPTESYLLMAAHAAGMEGNLVTAAYARRIAGWQRDGYWVTSDFRPPTSSSLFTSTATAVRAVGLYMPEELAAERDASLRAARQWLTVTRPASTEDATFRLLGLVWAGASPDEIGAAQRDLLALQKPAGGWPQLPPYEADAYSTGEALYALHEAGVPATDAAWRKGLKFLVSTEARDGTWRVRTRMLSPAEVSPTYFPTGFPYGKDEFLSYTGSCWAVMALLSALPESADGPVQPSADGPASMDVPSWTRTALFGTAGELAQLLDGGLDPNSKTDNGTTLLMMAAPDADKVRLLLSRGADPKFRAPSGGDALSVATAFYGTSASVRLLLTAGAETQPPEGTRVRKLPLDLASMTGDRDNVTELLAHGADPGAGEALPQAITFGYVDIVEALVKAGANTRLIEGTGGNLLHWAVITHRPAVIPALAKSGVGVNTVDGFGLTPLMYAATIDFGDAESVRELLKAGADRTIKDFDGRTAVEHARRYKHSGLAAALR